jgi:hypothetical protein
MAAETNRLLEIIKQAEADEAANATANAPANANNDEYTYAIYFQFKANATILYLQSQEELNEADRYTDLELLHTYAYINSRAMNAAEPVFKMRREYYIILQILSQELPKQNLRTAILIYPEMIGESILDHIYVYTIMLARKLIRVTYPEPSISNLIKYWFSVSDHQYEMFDIGHVDANYLQHLLRTPENYEMLTNPEWHANHIEKNVVEDMKMDPRVVADVTQLREFARIKREQIKASIAINFTEKNINEYLETNGYSRLEIENCKAFIALFLALYGMESERV